MLEIIEWPEHIKKQMAEERRRQEEIRRYLPEAFQIQKRKLSLALGKPAREITGEEEELLKKTPVEDVEIGFFVPPSRTYSSRQWTDATAEEKVRSIIEKYQRFDLKTYLDSAKAVCASFTGVEIHYDAFTYVLTHARRFGDTARTVFQLEDGPPVEIIQVQTELPTNEYASKISKLIDSLTLRYDEADYITLNVNITYLAMTSLRRSVRNATQFAEAMRKPNTHQNYAKLCPHPIARQLPKPSEEFNQRYREINMKPSIHLAIHAYLTTEDEKTKQALLTTFITHAEWTGLQLPKLFFQAANLYGMEPEVLWEHLSYESTYKGLFRLANAYYQQYLGAQSVPPNTTRWFPFCRILYHEYHEDLYASANEYICYVLAYLIDLKLGFDKSFGRNSHWTKKVMCFRFSTDALKLAKTIAQSQNEA